MARALSFSEISTALTCEARHAFGYTGRLTNGTVLKRRQLAPILSDGRAWGAAVATWHSWRWDLDAPLPLVTDQLKLVDYDEGQARMCAHADLIESVRHDVSEQRQRGVYVPLATIVDRVDRLAQMLDHYMVTADRMVGLTRIEGLLDIPLPARFTTGRSSRYRFQGFLDGFLPTDDDAGEWLVEFKLRRLLTPVALIARQRQIRWYAWARQQETGRPVIGVLVDERLNEAPHEPRILANGTPSHDRSQHTRAEWYEQACLRAGVPPRPSTVEALRARVWQQRVPIVFAPGELDAAGRELVSAAVLVRDLDSGARAPIRNAQAYLCRGCDYEPVCNHPEDTDFVDTLFTRDVPKRLRIPSPTPPEPPLDPNSPDARRARGLEPIRPARHTRREVNPFEARTA